MVRFLQKGVTEMKCLNCGARVKKSEEICPECGKFISTEKEYTIQPEDEINHEELEKAEEAVKHIFDSVPVKFDYNDYLLLPSLIRIGGGIVMMIASVVAVVDSSPFFRASSVYSVLFFIVAGILFIFNGIAAILQERKVDPHAQWVRTNTTPGKKRHPSWPESAAKTRWYILARMDNQSCSHRHRSTQGY